MWILSILPEWAFHTLLIVSLIATIAGFVLGMIPVIKRYAIPIKIFSIIALCLALYLEGGLADYREWEMKVQELQTKLAEAEARSADKNVEIQEKIVEKTRTIREKGDDIIRYIDREVVKKEEVIKYIEQCPIPQDIIDTHNKAIDLKGAKK